MATPAKPNFSYTEIEKHQLVNILREQHNGRDNAIKIADLLAEMFGEETARDRSTTNPHNRKLRAMIEEINNQGGLICSSSYHGYWWAKDLNDGMASVNENKARAMTQLGNVTKLEKNIAQAFTHQYGMNI